MNNNILQEIINDLKYELEIFSYTNAGKSLLKDRKIMLSAEFQENPKTFPYITITQIQNDYKDSTTEKIETETNLSYEISIYDNNTNKINVTKSLCEIVNNKMTSYGFRRTFNNSIPNIANAQVYREILRFSGSYNSEINKINKF
jgi:hypothetical protein